MPYVELCRLCFDYIDKGMQEYVTDHDVSLRLLHLECYKAWLLSRRSHADTVDLSFILERLDALTKDIEALKKEVFLFTAEPPDAPA